ncbi:hypothetical protein WAJ71_20265, partial [Acinetobacter baumannii]
YKFLKKDKPAQHPQQTSLTDYAPSTSAGNHFSEQELVNKMLASKSGMEIQRLLNGDTSGYDNDHSEADIALAGYLAFWTNRDAEKMDSI